MSLMTTLAEAYDACAEASRSASTSDLVPVCHATQSAHIEVTIDHKGEFCAAALTDEKERRTVIPCTEDSASRSGILPSPHPLFDKLQYLAAEYADQGRKCTGAFAAYREQLAAWCASPYAHESVKAILAYLDKGSLLADLAEAGVLYRADDGSFPVKKPKGDAADAYPIFKACATDQLDAFVRFRVWGNEDNDKLWESEAVRKSWIDYQNSLADQKVLCYISGELQAPSRKSPRNIRRLGDGAKLVSSNDSNGYTFRGRFANAEEALSIGREANEKAHGALRWLIAQQGYRYGERVIVAWLPGRPVPKAIFEDTRFTASALEKETLEIGPSNGHAPLEPNIEEAGRTGRTSARSFSAAMAGYRGTLDGMERAAIVGLDSVTKGRLSVFYYRETNAADLLDRVSAWHEECSWEHRYSEPITKRGSEGSPSKLVHYTGAPCPKTIAKTVYGENARDKLISKTIERLLPCITEGAPLPYDIVMSALRRASRPTTLAPWEAARAHSVACALIRKYNNDRHPEERITMETAKDLEDRDTKFGVILAYLRRIEERSLYVPDQKIARPTNAERFQEQYVKKPQSTLLMLHKRIQPHLKKLTARGDTWLELKMLEAISALGTDDMSDKPLGPRYLTGYASQYTALRAPRNASAEHDEGGSDEDQSLEAQTENPEIK